LRNSQFESSDELSGYLPVSLQLAPSINFSASPSNQPPTCVFDQSPALPSNLTSNPSSIVRPFSKSSGPSPACAFNFPSDPTFLPASGLRLLPTFRFRFRPGLRPSPPADPPAMPSNRLPACAFRRSSGSAFQPTELTCVSWSTFQLCFRT